MVILIMILFLSLWYCWYNILSCCYLWRSIKKLPKYFLFTVFRNIMYSNMVIVEKHCLDPELYTMHIEIKMYCVYIRHFSTMVVEIKFALLITFNLWNEYCLILVWARFDFKIDFSKNKKRRPWKLKQWYLLISDIVINTFWFKIALLVGKFIKHKFRRIQVVFNCGESLKTAL